MTDSNRLVEQSPAVEGVLKPCPFCGSNGVFTERGMLCAGCEDPDCIGHQIAYDFITNDDAAEHWNRRPTPSLSGGGSVLGSSAAPIPTERGDDQWAELERLARRCFVGDPWYTSDDLITQSYGSLLPQDRVFIAAANPAEVLKLIAAARANSVGMSAANEPKAPEQTDGAGGEALARELERLAECEGGTRGGSERAAETMRSAAAMVRKCATGATK
jgi:hypothetical protein